ncbi:E3 ubiquitin-protein ligase FANCL [Sigmodon hispidus]
MKHSPDLMSFLIELKKTLEVALKNRKELYIQPPSHSFYTDLLNEIGAVGWDKLVCVYTSFSTVKVKAEHASGRKHVITVKLKVKHPREPPDCIVDFSVPFSISWTPQSSLVNVHNQFLVALESLKAFWHVMNETDEETWVLEAEKPPWSITTCRLALGPNVSINIDIDPKHPTMLPEFCFLGAVIKPLGIKLSGNIH